MRRFPFKYCLFITIFYLTANFHALARMQPTSQLPQQRLRREIKAILGDPHYNYLDYWLNLKKFLRNILNFFLKLHPGPFKIPSEPLRQVLGWIGIVALLALPIFLFYFLKRFYRGNRALRSGISGPQFKLAQPESLEQTAITMAKQGDFRGAIRNLYLACLAGLTADGVLPQSTLLADYQNLKNARRVWGNDHPSFLAFACLVATFQEKWYGLKQCSPEDFYNCQRLMKTIRGR